MNGFDGGVTAITETRFDPALDPEWTPIEKLRWRAACLLLEYDLSIEVDEVEPRRFRPAMIAGREILGNGSYSYEEMWGFLNGLECGTAIHRRRESRDTPR